MLQLPERIRVIAYSLICKAGHEFEGWFANSTAYTEQAKAGELACPVCGDTSVTKAIMAPAVMTSVTKAKGRTTPASVADERQQVRQFVAGFRKFVEENADYVGPQFPEEARKIHYGETEARHIYGESTLAQAKELIEEGIDIAPMPPDPNSLN
jgi:hypothetical protein